MTPSSFLVYYATLQPYFFPAIRNFKKIST